VLQYFRHDKINLQCRAFVFLSGEQIKFLFFGRRIPAFRTRIIKLKASRKLNVAALILRCDVCDEFRIGMDQLKIFPAVDGKLWIEQNEPGALPLQSVDI
jgi:hypothetical protein